MPSAGAEQQRQPAAAPALSASGTAAPAPSRQRPPAPRRRSQATATGTKLRGFHSNSSSSTASSTAATGVPKIAVMPAAAPATSSVLRSAVDQMEELREQRAERAAGHDDRAFRAERAAGADRDRRRQRLEHRDLAADMRLLPIRIASIASGMPWPRIFSEPKRAIRPMIRPPTTGNRHRPARPRHGPAIERRRGTEAAEIGDVGRQRDQVEQHPGRHRRRRCRRRPPSPTSRNSRRSVLKSRSRSCGSAGCEGLR